MTNTERILKHIEENIFETNKRTELEDEAIRIATEFFQKTHDVNVKRFSKYTSDFEKGYIISKTLDYFSMYAHNYYLLSFKNISDREIIIQKLLIAILKDIQKNVIFSF